MSANWGLSGGELSITADRYGSQVSVVDLNTVNSRYGAPILLVTATSQDGTWQVAVPKMGVNQIKFTGSRYDDVFAMNTGFRFLGQPDYLGTSYGAITGYISGGYGNDVLTGGIGNDVIIGGFGRDRIDGKGGNDTIYGDDTSAAYKDTDSYSWQFRYGAADELIGGTGNDTIHGGGGDDVIEGGRGNDHLYGGNDDDTIYGDEDNDMIWGQIGNDNLYGGAGVDVLHGGSGNDGLYGGYGLDGLYGEAGSDRFLVHNSTGLSLDVVIDAEAKDATVFFEDGQTGFELMGSNIGWVQVVGQRWSEDDIEMVDGALQALHDLTGNTRLLETADGQSTIISRYGNVFKAVENDDGSKSATTQRNTSLGGWNVPNSPEFAITGIRFAEGEDEVHRVVFHELGHNWDEASENSFANDFRAVAGWRSFAPGTVPAGYEKGGDNGSTWNNWYFINKDTSLDGFARSYGKMNPLEDFATSFAAFMMARTGRNYASGLTWDGEETPDEINERLEDRFDVLYEFLGQMGASNRSDWPV